MIMMTDDGIEDDGYGICRFLTHFFYKKPK